MVTSPLPFNPITPTPFIDPVNDGTYHVLNQPLGMRRKLRVIGIGAGPSGINMAYKIKSHLHDVEFVAYEKNPDVGGTWFENVYPGVACDTNSHGYAFTYHLKADWTAIFSSGGEIQEYMLDVVRKHDLRKYFRFNHKVVDARWHPDTAKWHVKVENEGKVTEDICDVLINAGGLLNHWKWPSIPGLQSFKGEKVHTAHWDKNIDLKGKRVALIGAGSSGIQVLPNIRHLAEHISIFIRSRTWVAPPREGELLKPDVVKRYMQNPKEHLEYCQSLEHLANQRFRYIYDGSEEQKTVFENWTASMKTGLANRPEIFEALAPDFGVGCRRPTPGPGFLDALQADNVDTIFAGIDSIDERGVFYGDKHVPVDVIICATGFDVSFKPRFPVIGREDIDLRDQWSDTPRAYLSMFAPNFPNYITVLGPGAPSAQGSIIVSIERISDYIIKLLHKLQHEPIKTIEIQSEVLAELSEHTAEQLKLTVWTHPCSSWFKNGLKDGPVIGLHPGGRLHFFSLLMDPRWEDFKYTYWNRNRFAYWGNGLTLREMEGRDDTWYLKYADGLDLHRF